MLMKKKMLISIIAILGVAVLIIVFYAAPKTIGKNIKASEVDHINVFDGSTGVGFVIDNPEEIQYIVENIQSRSLKRDGFSFGYTGYSFKINYMDVNDKNILSEFIVNSDDTIRKDPFFYRCEGGLCFDYLKNMEEKYASN